MSAEKAIQILQKVFNLQLSNEQKQVILYNHQTPILVNSCAGAGKTTLLMFNIFYLILTNQAKPQEILGITFSRAAKQNMVNKYNTIKAQLLTFGYRLPTDATPDFRTFHSLFYWLLRYFPRFKYAQVVTGYTAFLYQLRYVIKFRNQALNETEQLKQIFQNRDGLINNCNSFDGLTINHGIAELKRQGWLIKDDKISPLGRDASNQKPDKNTQHQIYNYVRVIQTYLNLKHRYNKIDFNDMKVLLLRAMGEPRHRDVVKKVMQRFKFCFIDEFQDIDSLQNQLMKMILSQTASHNLSVIGDDDQSIYSFRGANPSIIMNYTKTHHAKKFQLSTNYRTNAKILAGVKPLISRNQYRIQKSLKSNNHKTNSGLFEIVNSLSKKRDLTGQRKTNHDSGLVLLHLALNRAMSNSKGSVVILTRFNSDRMVAVDFLANHRIYVKPGELLQRNNVYQIYHHIMLGLFSNDVRYVNGYLQKIDFFRYANHIKSIQKLLRKHYQSTNKWSQVLSISSRVCQKYLRRDHNPRSKRRKLASEDLQVDDNILHAIRSVQKNPTGSNTFSEAHSLVSKYLNYMIQKKYMNNIIVGTITNLLKIELAHYPQVSVWFDWETNKIRKFKNLQQSKRYNRRISVMTIHNSKGLQFDYVYLYNLTDRNVKDRLVAINKAFAPHLPKMIFLKRILQIPLKQLGKLDESNDNHAQGIEVHADGLQYYYNSMLHRDQIATEYTNLRKALDLENASVRGYLNHEMKKAPKRKLRAQHVIHHLQVLVTRNALLTHLSKDVSHNYLHLLKIIQYLFNNLYPDAMDISAHVEEERRLIYVGFTRATAYATFNLPTNPNPLLFEMNVNKHNILHMRNGKLSPVIEDKSNKVRSVDKKIQKLLKEKEAIQNGKTSQTNSNDDNNGSLIHNLHSNNQQLSKYNTDLTKLQKNKKHYDKIYHHTLSLLDYAITNLYKNCDDLIQGSKISQSEVKDSQGFSKQIKKLNQRMPEIIEHSSYDAVEFDSTKQDIKQVQHEWNRVQDMIWCQEHPKEVLKKQHQEQNKVSNSDSNQENKSDSDTNWLS